MKLCNNAAPWAVFVLLFLTVCHVFAACPPSLMRQETLELQPKTTVAKKKIRVIHRKPKSNQTPKPSETIKKAQTEEMRAQEKGRPQSSQKPSRPIQRPVFGLPAAELESKAVQALIDATKNSDTQPQAFAALGSISLDKDYIDRPTLQQLLRRGLSGSSSQGTRVLGIVQSLGLPERDINQALLETMETADLDRREQVLALLSGYRERLARPISKLLRQKPAGLNGISKDELERKKAANDSLCNQQVCSLRLVEIWGPHARELTPAILEYFNHRYDQAWFDKHQDDPIHFVADDANFDYLHVLYAIAEIGPSAKAGLPLAIHASKSNNEKIRQAGILCIEKIMAKNDPWLTPSDERRLITLLGDSETNRRQIQEMFLQAQQRESSTSQTSSQSTRTANQSSSARTSSARTSTRSRSRRSSTIGDTRHQIEGAYGRLRADYDSRVNYADKIMTQLDDDKSGILSEEEFDTGLFQPQMDWNRDGLVDRRELIGFYLLGSRNRNR